MSLSARMRAKSFNREAPKQYQDPGPKSVGESVEPMLMDIAKGKLKRKRPPIWIADGK